MRGSQLVTTWPPATTRPDTLAPELITEQAALEDVVTALRGEAVYALDTEFHRERTYAPKLALVQIAWADEAVLVDPFECDLTSLAPIFDLSLIHI